MSIVDDDFQASLVIDKSSLACLNKNNNKAIETLLIQNMWYSNNYVNAFRLVNE